MNNASILIDTDAIVALTIEKDSNHKKALETQDELEKQKADIQVTNLVIQEVVTVLSHRVGQKLAIDFYNRIKSNPPKIIFVDESLEELAYQVFLKQTKKGTSFVDCANMAVMKHFGLTTILSFDQIYKRNDFKRAGID